MIEQALEHAKRQLAVDRLDAELLLAKVLNKSRSFVLSWPKCLLNEDQLELFLNLSSRRSRGEPLAYLTGEKEFWSINLQVNPQTLIPRPETEQLVEQVLKHIPPTADWSILDLGTGTGAIALALATERPRCQVHASDISPQALQTAKKNGELLELSNIIYTESDLFLNIKEKFNIIVSNPPYVEPGDPHLHALRFEPQEALVAEEKGLGVIKKLCTQAKDYLRAPGILAIEHGYDQSEAVQRLFVDNKFKHVTPYQDYNQHWRGVLGRLW